MNVLLSYLGGATPPSPTFEGVIMKRKWIDIGNGVKLNADLLKEEYKDRVELTTGEVYRYGEFPKIEFFRDDLYESIRKD